MPPASTPCPQGALCFRLVATRSVLGDSPQWAAVTASKRSRQEEARAQGQSSAYATRELSGALGDGVEHAERQADAEQPAMVEETRDPDQYL